MATDEILEILKAFRKAIKPGDRVRHIVDWTAGTVVGKIHVMYETGVRFDDRPTDPSPVYLRNLYPVWWPAPEWVKPEELRIGRKDEERLSQPLSLGLLKSICQGLLVDSAPSTKLVAIAIIRGIDGLPVSSVTEKSGSRNP